jgi:hypothetical protein
METRVDAAILFSVRAWAECMMVGGIATGRSSSSTGCERRGTVPVGLGLRFSRLYSRVRGQLRGEAAGPARIRCAGNYFFIPSAPFPPNDRGRRVRANASPSPLTGVMEIDLRRYGGDHRRMRERALMKTRARKSGAADRDRSEIFFSEFPKISRGGILVPGKGPPAGVGGQGILPENKIRVPPPCRGTCKTASPEQAGGSPQPVKNPNR